MSQIDTVRMTPFASYADEDDVLDAWLASLGASQFEHILSRLAESPNPLIAARDESA